MLRALTEAGVRPDLVVGTSIGAVNGATFTGGLELALGCDFLIASDRAIFADTHARVGILPRGGMTARLPLVVGGAQARRMSMTGQVIDAATAERIGLVTEVVPHDRLMARVMDCARAIAEVPPDTVRGLMEMYVAQAAVAPGLAAEREIARRHVPDWAGLEKRRLDVMARNRALSPSAARFAPVARYGGSARSSLWLSVAGENASRMSRGAGSGSPSGI